MSAMVQQILFVPKENIQLFEMPLPEIYHRHGLQFSEIKRIRTLPRGVQSASNGAGKDHGNGAFNKGPSLFALA